MIKDTKQKLKEEGNTDGKIEEWISTIADQAKHEHQLSRTLTKIKHKWDVHLTTTQVDNRMMVQDMPGILNTLNECMTGLDIILTNEYAAPLKNDAEEVYNKIAKIEEILLEMNTVESKMKIVDDLLTREEFKSHTFSNNRYDEVQKAWKRYLKRVGTSTEASRDTLSQRFLTEDTKGTGNYQEVNRKGCYQELSRKMDEIIIEMESKNEDKQLDFPRFYFMSNQDFIRILCTYEKLPLINAFANKIFPSIREIILVEENDEHFVTRTSHREMLMFISSFPLRGFRKNNSEIKDPSSV